MNGTSSTLNPESVNYEHRLPLETWAQGAPVVPPFTAVAKRVEQLELFSALFHGEYWRLIDDLYVTINYHDETATFLADVLVSRPPEFNFAGDNPLSGRFMMSLLDILPNLIIDTVRYGVGLIQIVDGDYGIECQAPQPVYWFPVDDNTSTLFSGIGTGEITQYIDYSDGSWDEITWRETPHLRGFLGERVGGDRGEAVGGFEAVGAETTGRQGLLIPVVREPNTGDWGRSLYASITSPAIEINRVYNMMHGIVDKARPVLTPEYLEGRGPTDFVGQQDNDLVIQKIQADYQERLQYEVFIPPRDVRELKFMQPDISVDAHLKYKNDIEEQLYALTYIPAALYGLFRSGPPASGVALDRQYVRTSAYIQQTQATIIKALRKALLTGLAMINRGGQIAEINAGLEIGWPNFFDSGDLVQDDEGEMTDEGGENGILQRE